MAAKGTPSASQDGEEHVLPGRTHTLRLMMILRVVVVTALLGSALFVQLFYGLTSDSLYFIIGLTYLLTVFYAVLLEPLSASNTFVFIQIVIDTVLVSLLVLVTGGVDSAFIILYYLLVLTTAVALGRLSSFAIATIAGLMFAALALVANSGTADLSFLFPYTSLPLKDLVFRIGIHLFALEFVAAMSGYLAGRLQRTAANLLQRTADLRRLQVLNENIVRSIASGIITTDMSGTITFVNPAARILIQRGRSVILGSYIYDLLEFNPDAPQLIMRGESWSREMFLRRDKGDRIDVGVSRSFLIEADSDQVGKLYLIQDLTEIKALQAQLLLRDSMATAGEMSAAIAHEIRNPLGAISGSAQMIRKAPDLPDDQKYFMDIIVSESERLSSILNGFLAFAREPVFSPVEIDLITVGEETAALLSNSPEVSAAHTVRFSSDGLETLMAQVDPNMVRQMIYNLAANGVNAMPDGGTLEIALRRDNNYAVLEVRDSGSGVDPLQLKRMFQPFSTSTPGGFGLGLAIVYKIVQQHCGKIIVKSKKGKGTSVRIFLPIVRGEGEEFSVNVELLEN